MIKVIKFVLFINRSLIDEWLLLGPGRRYITNKTDLAAIDSEATDQVMGWYQLNFSILLSHILKLISPGIFTNSYVTWDDMLEQKPTVPSIAEMAVASVKFLKEKSGPEGFFVMIEVGGEFFKFLMMIMIAFLW